MAFITESGELSVGVKMLDCDHREMSQAIHDLHAATMQDRSLTGPLLRRLTDFTLTHFALEEGMMHATKYPGIALHRLHHQYLIGELKALIACHQQKDSALTPSLLRSLSAWHAEHVHQDDMHYGIWLNQSGRCYHSLP